MAVNEAEKCDTNTKQYLRQRASLVVTDSPETVIEWMKQNVHRVPAERLYEALAIAIRMRDGD